MHQTVLGIDVSKDKFDVALLFLNKTYSKVFKNNNQGFDQLVEWLQKHEINDLHACMEATGIYGNNLANYLYELGHKISVVNPAQIKGFSLSELARTKTDKIDAKLIARFCLAIHPEAWKPLPAHIRQLQAWINRLESLVSMRQQEINRLEVSEKITVDNIQENIDFLSMHVENIKKKIKDHIDNNPELKNKSELLKSIPGVGETTVSLILTFLFDDSRFKSAKQVVAYLGLNPKHKISGTSVKGRSHISKTGCGKLRKAFYMPAVVAKNHNPIIKKFCARLEVAGKHKMLIICAAMRKLIHMIFGVLKSGVAFNAEY